VARKVTIANSSTTLIADQVGGWLGGWVAGWLGGWVDLGWTDLDGLEAWWLGGWNFGLLELLGCAVLPWAPATDPAPHHLHSRAGQQG